MKIPLLPEAIALFTGTLLVSQTMAATDFTAEIEPLLIRRCFECHGPDKQKSNLRLDSRVAAFQAAESGKVVLEVGKPETSELIRRVTATDPDEIMPPKGPRLTPAEVASLTRWIREGAIWPDSNIQKHWSFQAPIRPNPPENLPKTATLQNPIDRFIVARLAKEGLQQQPEADRANLIRRVSLDLTGLPPAPSEISAFLADNSPRAFETLVDRLLASSHYGEHMARGWLDLARYADSNGYQVDLARSIWPYRQWVIEAFNKNQPFDQFTIDQLAGDLLPQPTLAQRIATGFNRNTKVNDEGGGDAEEYRTKAVKDRVATVGTAWLGLSLNCAECHTHKYDPITHEEYYRFYSFFNNSSDSGNYSLGPSVEVPKPDLTDIDAHLSRRLQETRDELSRIEKELQKSQAVWEKSVARKADPWRTLQLVNPQSTGGSSYTNLPDGSLLGTGVNAIYDTITVEAETDLIGITAVLLEVLPDPSLPKNGPGRWGASGNFILDEFSFAAAPMKGAAPANTNLFFSSATADWEQQYYKAEHAIDRNSKTGWSIGPRFGQRHFLIARLQDPTGYRGGSRLTFRFDHYHGNSHCIGRFRISVTTEKDPQRQWPLPEDVRVAASRSSQERSTEQSALLAASQRSASEKVRTLERELFVLEQNRRQRAGQKFTTLVMQERTDPQPRETYIHLRGDFLTKGKVVQPGIPAVFPSLPAGLPANRLTLARWLVDPANPLTARVTVNRFWERCFGTGLVKTSEDFGRQGELPSHPELLDWLATEFIASGWDVKALQKLIVMSATYRQSAATDAIRQEKDFYNRFLSRGPRFRMDAEMIRDHALAVSGLLHNKVGGPSVYPVQVANLWKEIGFLRPEIGMDEWPVSDGPDLYRRALYTFWRRVCTYPTLATFDAPSRDVCVSRRPRTNTPLQALAALNEPTLLEAARFFGQRILAEGGPDDASRVDYAFTRSVGRPPTAVEQRRLLAFVQQQERSFRADPKAAAALIQVGQASKAADLETRKLAVWTTLASVLFNLDETLTKG